METQIGLHYQVKKKLKAATRGSHPARVAKRAQILLGLNRGERVEELAERLDCGSATVKRVRCKYLKEGWERAIYDAPRPGRPKKLSEREERELIALACSDPPQSRARWTVRLLVEHCGKEVGFGVVQQVLKNDSLKPWREKNVVRSHDRCRVRAENERCAADL